MEQLVASLDEYRQAAADEEKCLDYHLDTVRKRLQDLEREDLEREDGPEGLNQQAVDETLRAGLGKTSEQAERVQLQTAHAGLDQAEEACLHRGGWTLLPTLSPGEREREREGGSSSFVRVQARARENYVPQWHARRQERWTTQPKVQAWHRGHSDGHKARPARSSTDRGNQTRTAPTFCNFALIPEAARPKSDLSEAVVALLLQ